MDKNYVAIISQDNASYPAPNYLFRPHIAYPEYLFQDAISAAENVVYEMVRETFRILRLDASNYGTSSWNPLGDFIKTGDKILLKPNLVLEQNYNPSGGIECIYTHPSIVAAVIDYALIALEGHGEIIVGDAPLQQCKFEQLIHESGYGNLIMWYRHRGINIRIADLRTSDNRVNCEGGIQYPQSLEKHDEGILVRLDKHSAFCELSETTLQKMRVMDFDPRILQRHHTKTTHAYMIAKEVLEADVILNLPKIKTHKIAGITGALKNMIGTSANKDYLPHYTLGGKDEGGDAYLRGNYWLDVADNVMDIKNIFNRENKYMQAQTAVELYGLLYHEGHIGKNVERYENGCWYGNDTLWRTIADVNRVVMYADKHGVIKKEPQRKMFIVGDMIISGEGEGPVAASPHQSNLVISGGDSLAFDRIICAIMGFEENAIPQLSVERMCNDSLKFCSNEEPVVISNRSAWNEGNTKDVRANSLRFIPASTWEYVLGNPIKDDLLELILTGDKSVVIFGAGRTGIDLYKYIKKHYPSLKVDSFWDNDKKKQGNLIVDGIGCRLPCKAQNHTVCLIAAMQSNVASMFVQAEVLGFSGENVIIFSSSFVGNGANYKKLISHTK